MKWSAFLGSTILFFTIYLISLIYNFPYNSGVHFFIFLKQSEFKDILLFFAFLLTVSLDTKELKKIEFSFVILLFIILVTGFLSIFSIYRFTYLFNSLFREVATWKYQHHYGEVAGVNIYLPIGLMNTHLTFGGLLAFLLPFAFFRGMEIFNKYSRFLERILLLSAGLFLVFVVLLNNARSAIFGVGVSILLGIFINIFIKKIYDIKFIGKYIFIPVVSISMLLMALSFTEPFRKTVLPLIGGKKHTDSGRTFIWDSSFSMIEKNPFLGVGPGNYPPEIDKMRKERSEKNPELLFFYEVTQRGHAHNDFFHIISISGILNGLIFLSLLYFIIRKIVSKARKGEDISLYLGLVGFFFAGSFQCYFQDDEVVIVFWYLAGLLFQDGELD